ncbi:MAG: biotin transporter BioY [Dethiobacter sp.]|jgi:biotin transport system substrate-specific component|nr:biotin transporter BioY [Dethiobacter sp.]MBS3990029.1 biotin transporter BioY [Dethiobacter sp.]
MKQKYAVRDLVLIALFAALTAIMAYIAVPMPAGLPPITGQTFAVMLAGLLLGANKGAMSQIIYILLGVVGLPVFAGGTSGLSILVGRSGGFLIGFVLGAFLIGKLTENKREPSLRALSFAALLGGVIVVYIPGILQMAMVLGIPLETAAGFMLPFLPGDFIKVAVSSLLAQRILLALPGKCRPSVN